MGTVIAARARNFFNVFQESSSVYSNRWITESRLNSFLGCAIARLRRLRAFSKFSKESSLATLGNPRSARQLPPRTPIHLVLRASAARGTLSLLRQARRLEEMARVIAARHRVKVHGFANAGNHLSHVEPARRKRL